MRVHVFIALAVLPAATAQPLRWDQLPATGIRSVDEAALARGVDGSLHVLWRQPAEGGTSEFRHLVLDPDGKSKGPAQVAVGGWKTLSNPALLVAPGGSLELLFGGVLGSDDRKDPYNNGSLYRAIAPADGSQWELQPGAQSKDQQAYLGPIGAAFASDGQFWTSWPASMKFAVQRGLGNAEVQQLHEGGCCPYEGQVAVDADGQVIAGWYSNAGRKQGILLRPVAPVLGEASAAPGSYTESGGQVQSRSLAQQLALVRRGGAPGVYVAYCAGYPVCTAIQLWRYRDPQPVVVAKVKQGRTASLAQGPEGRLWVMWVDEGGTAALRTNKAATRLGPVIRAGQAAVFKVRGEGSAGPLDLIANTGSALLHTRVFPPLQVAVAPHALEAGKGGTVKFSVTDVGDPVAGAAVSIGGQALKTGPDGSASYSVAASAKPGSISASIQMAGYQPAAASLEVRPPKPPQR